MIWKVLKSKDTIQPKYVDTTMDNFIKRQGKSNNLGSPPLSSIYTYSPMFQKAQPHFSFLIWTN